MDFLKAVDNVQREKKIPPRGEVGSIYELMVYAMPAGRFRTRSVKKGDQGAISLASGTNLERKVREYFGVWGRESISTLLEVLKRQGVGIDDLKVFFGLNTGKVKIRAPVRHNPPAGDDRPNPKEVRDPRGFAGVQRERAPKDR